MVHFVHFALNNILTLGALSFLLIVTPILGIMAIHEHGRDNRT
jgi:hypothetical protein